MDQSKAWDNVHKEILQPTGTDTFRKLNFHLATKKSTSFNNYSTSKMALNESALESKDTAKPPHQQSQMTPNNLKASSLESEVQLPSPGLFDLKVVSTHMQWSNIVRVGPGLHNFGNTCYLNSTLQCLLYIPALTQIILHQNDAKLALKGLVNQDESRFITLQYRKFAMEMFRNGDRKHTVTPKDLVQNIRKVGKQFRHQRQEDAHEYLVQLLDCMHEEILKANNKKSSEGKICDTTFIRRVFGGYLCNQLKCPKCKFVSKTFNYYQSLSLDIMNGISTVRAALQDFTQPEQLSRGNEWKCEKCKQDVKAVKQFRLASLPPVLVIHLKRFSFGMGFGKISKHVRFEMTIDIPHEDSICTYELCGLIVHHGSSVHSGHYVAFVKAPNGQWHEMNDGQVTVRPINHVLVQQAYILFYTRKSMPSERPPSNEIPSTTPVSQSLNGGRKDGNPTTSLKEAISANDVKSLSKAPSNEPAAVNNQDIGVPVKQISKQPANKSNETISNFIPMEDHSMSSVPMQIIPVMSVAAEEKSTLSKDLVAEEKLSEVTTSETSDDTNSSLGSTICSDLLPFASKKVETRLKTIDSWRIRTFRWTSRTDRLSLWKPSRLRKLRASAINEKIGMDSETADSSCLTNTESTRPHQAYADRSTRNDAMVEDIPLDSGTDHVKSMDEENHETMTQQSSSWGNTPFNSVLSKIDQETEVDDIRGKRAYGETIRLLNHATSNGFMAKDSMIRNSKRGREPGSEGSWDNTNEDNDAMKAASTAKSITQQKLYEEQQLLASRQASEWDKNLDRGHQKKIRKIESDEKFGKVNYFQIVQDEKNKTKN